MPKKTPRPHQRAAVKAVVKGFKSHDRGKLIMACGTGKTLIAGWVREALKAGCTLFMAPSNALLAQTLQAWREVSKKPFKALAVCGDRSVADGRDEDDLPAADVGATVTTDYKDIARFISSTGNRVVLCTYQSSEALALAMSLVKVPEFDLAIADEAHRTTGGADHLFPSITHPEKIRAAKRLFMTATQRFYYDNQVDKIVSMDNEEVYGPTFFELDFAEAIRLKLLTDYEVLIVGISPEAEKEAEQLLKQNPRLKVADRRMTARDLAVHIAILRTIKERNLKRVITFHNSCPKASAAADFLPQLQDWMPKKYQTDVKLWARTVNHKINIGDRHELLRQFVALKGPGILTNARCLGEGVDVPTVDAIAFMDSKKSKIEIAQSVGRAIRKSAGKEKSYIILPVIMLPGDDQGQINSKSFKPAFDVINALRAHDSTLMDQLQHWNDRGSHGVGGRRGRGGGNEGRKITFDVPEDCDPKIAEWFVLATVSGAPHWTIHWPSMLQAITRKKNANKPLAADEKQWLQWQAYAIKRRVLKPQRVRSVTPLLSHFGVTVRSHDEMVDKALGHARAILAESQARGYRKGMIAASLVSALKRARKAKWMGTPEAQEILHKLEAIPPYRSWAAVSKLPGAADAIDAYVAKYGCRPPTSAGPYGKTSGHTAMAVWLPKAAVNPALLYGVRPAEWPARILALPTQTATYKDAMAARAAAATDKVPARLARLTAFVARHKRFPRSNSKSETSLYNWMHDAMRRGSPRTSARITKAVRALLSMIPAENRPRRGAPRKH